MHEAGVCVAPNCGAETTSPYHHICDACVKRVEQAMIRARPSLMERMVQERAEAEAWLADQWAPRRRWVIVDGDYHERPLDEVAAKLAKSVSGGWGDCLGFVDDARHARWESMRRERVPDAQERPITAWCVSEDSEAGAAFKAHLVPFVKEALARALATFPLTWAGRDIKYAITHPNEYSDPFIGFNEIWEGTGPTGLSAAAADYLDIRYYRDEDWICEVDAYPDTISAHLWKRYRVLSDDIMAILDALESAKATQARQSDES